MIEIYTLAEKLKTFKASNSSILIWAKAMAVSELQPLRKALRGRVELFELSRVTRLTDYVFVMMI